MSFSRHRRHRHSAQSGMTMLEIMIVLAIIGGLMAVLGGGMLKGDETRLREAGSQLMTTLRSAYNMATMTGKHHRVVFDLEAQSYQVEVCTGKQVLVRGDKEAVPDQDALERIQEKMKEKAARQVDEDIMSAETPEDAFASAAALEGVRVGTTRCQPVGASVPGQKGKGSLRKLDTKRGIEISKIYVQHLNDPVEEETVSINFFPVGSAEKAVVVISNGEEEYSVLVFGMTSRVKLVKDEVDADEHMYRNAIGDKEADR
ncbi:MAG: type II secretion system protein [Kofleriaceae bacterium]|nr:type II secretion system protein [Kofleriaceae bacterium]